MSRTEMFVADDLVAAGERHQVGAADVVNAWVQFTGRIPTTFPVGVAQHETNFTVNERDVEDDGTTTDGIFQLETVEAIEALRPEANLFDLSDAAAVFAAIMDRKLSSLVSAAGLDEATFWARGGAGYLAWSHVAGVGEPLQSIATYGLDWSALKARDQNDWMRGQMIPYGDDAISGGASWDPAFASTQASTWAGIGQTVRTLLLLAALAFVGFYVVRT